MRAFTSDDEERKLVVDEDDGFVACYAHGEWHDRNLVDVKKMRELDLEEDMYEVGGLVRQARRALRRFL